jgi:lipopolysaccharide biosynthesis glycosyltransferase
VRANNLNSEETVVPARANTEPIVVVCAADDRYSMPLAVTIRSALEHLRADRQMMLFILDGGIETPNKQKILQSLSSEQCEVTFISISNADIEGLEVLSGLIDHVSIASYYRLLIANFIPERFDKAIYLDCDLVVKGDLSQLWEISLGDNYALAAQDTWTHFASQGLLNYHQLGIAADAKYFNAGVLVINLKKWRTDRISIKAVEYLQQNRKYIQWHDQDVLNALFASRWGVLDPRWNVPVFLLFNGESVRATSPFTSDIYRSVIAEPYIIHYTTERKPWNSRHTHCPEHFCHYVDMTAWKGWRLTIGRLIGLKLKREVRKFMAAN